VTTQQILKSLTSYIKLQTKYKVILIYTSQEILYENCYSRRVLNIFKVYANRKWLHSRS